MSTVEEFFQVLQLPDRSGRPKYQRLADTLGQRRALLGPGDGASTSTGMTTLRLTLPP